MENDVQPVEKKRSRAGALLKYFWLSSLLFVFSLFSWGFDKEIDACADDYFRGALVKATGTFVAARTANAVVSVVKSSRVSAEPLGVGVGIGVGEWLDPVDDVIETFSNVMFTAIVSLSVQKIAYEFVAAAGGCGLLVIAAALLVFYPLTRWRWGRIVCGNGVRIFILLAMLRCLLPLCALTNAAADSFYFDPETEKHSAALRVFTTPVENIGDEITGKTNRTLSERVDDIKKCSVRIFENASAIVDTSLALAGLVIAQFCLQVIVLPLASFLLFRFAVKKLYGIDMPALISAVPEKSVPASVPAENPR